MASPSLSPQLPGKVDLSNCDKEQVQFSGAVQPHACLIALAAADSDSVIALAMPAQFSAGVRSIKEILGPAAAAELRPKLARLTEPAPPIKLLRCRFQNEARHLFAHRMGAHYLLELERDGSAGVFVAEDLQQETALGLGRLHQVTGYFDFLQEATQLIARLTGFERVMAYRFLEDGSGQVVAETVAPGLESYNGLHYPASDIPLPARRLFSMTWLRHLPNVDYTPVPILSAPGTPPLDLTYVFSRSVSAMYTQYLRNMGVKATLVLTLLRDGKLWGLISCMEHAAPRHITYETRLACELLAHSISILMATKEDAASFAYRQRLTAQLQRMTEKLFKAGTLAEGLCSGPVNMLSDIEASGAAFVRGTQISLVGQTPPAPVLKQIVTEVACHTGGGAWCTDDLSKHAPSAAGHLSSAAGMLIVPLSQHQPDFAVWLRGEYLQMVRWAGDPNKPVETEIDNGLLKLSPRHSFSVWLQTIQGKSAPWLNCELHYAESLGRIIRDKRESELTKLNVELERSNRELADFAHSAGHDIKEPLRGIYGLAELIRISAESRLSSDEKLKLSSLLRLTARLDELTEALLQLSKVGGSEIRRRQHSMGELVKQAADLLSSSLAGKRTELTIEPDFPTVFCDAVLVREVLQNLISNAIKYTDKTPGHIHVGWRQLAVPTFFVRDDGIGIHPKNHELIFKIFRRLHRSDAYGGGTGAGLAIVRRAIERHGGHIWVESQFGAGSTFFFTLQPDESGS